jgi:dTDP-4-amino-4,6-dideoxygalactose transaminase
VDQYGHLFGLNYRLNALAAGIGIAQISKLEKKIVQRTQNASFYNKNINKKHLTELAVIGNGRPSYYAIVYRVSHSKISATELGRKLNEYGIISDTHRFKYNVLYKMSLFEKFASACPNAEILAQSIITLPTHEGLSEDDLKFITNKVNYLLKG